MRGVHLNNLEFFGYHGWHSEEGTVGANFSVDVSVFFEEANPVRALTDSINYVGIFDILKTNMSVPVKLLETLAEQNCEDIRRIDERIKTINIKITKLNPPILNFMGTVSVSLSKSY